MTKATFYETPVLGNKNCAWNSLEFSQVNVCQVPICLTVNHISGLCKDKTADMMNTRTESQLLLPLYVVFSLI